ncbi:hypothetical protein C8Q78DRAFT_1194055 [Trametes maxima]|nr:hypothetical protein C8Q78DRAFT_1194055 [Trametes maxima]
MKDRRLFRCLDCNSAAPHCSACLLALHKGSNFSRALHRPEQWNGSFFEIISLSALGLIVDLGHDNKPCPDPAVVREVLIFHVNGYHTVNIRMCECITATSDAPPPWRQFLRASLFPATQIRPTTAFTIELLKLFHALNLKAKTNVYDFYQTLLRVTDNSGLAKHPHRYKQFCHTVRLWRHLRQLKRGGRGHHPEGVSGTPPGSLAVACPACPCPGKNLPEDWELAPADKLWLYTLYLMMDANFKCRCKDRGLDDVELAPGWSYYVNEERFQEYLKNTANYQAERNTCSAEHNAILKANLRKEGYIASGIGAVFCARHAFFRPNGAGDLHLGEKYPYMDYLLVSTLLGVLLLLLVISYDIACQYSKNFERRILQNFTGSMHLDLEDVNVRWVIPKNHIAVHGPNHSKYSLNFNSKVGRTYGEGCESAWPDLNQASVSTREMALATRHDVLNDHMASWNWAKFVGIGEHLLKGLKNAHKMSLKQRATFNEFSDTFPPDVVREWMRQFELWCANPNSVRDPFEEPQSNVSRDKVYLELAHEEANLLSVQSLPQLDLSPSVFIRVGLDLEEQQYDRRSLRAKMSLPQSDKDTADLLQQRSVLRRRILYWSESQNVYMPSVAQLRLRTNTTLASPSDDSEPVDHSDVPETAAEDIVLWLPSSLPPDLLVGDLTKRLAQIELRIRLAQANDSLVDIRRIRRMLKGISEFKRMNVIGMGGRANTRSRALYAKFLRKQSRASGRYRAAFQALLNLDPDGEWKRTFQQLLDAHLTGPSSDDVGPGEGMRTISWIWLVQRDIDAEDPDESRRYDESMRAEWAKSKARAERWEEEEELTVEEMRRVLASLQSDVAFWEDLVERRTKEANLPRPFPFDIADGVRAYAWRQVSVRRHLISKFANLWLPQLTKFDVYAPWAAQYEPLVVAMEQSTQDEDVEESDGGEDLDNAEENSMLDSATGNNEEY